LHPAQRLVGEKRTTLRLRGGLAGAAAEPAPADPLPDRAHPTAGVAAGLGRRRERPGERRHRRKFLFLLFHRYHRPCDAYAFPLNLPSPAPVPTISAG